jgi:hypothetical protein
MSDYVRELKKNVMRNFSPRVVVAASHEAERIIAANFITPAELFIPFRDIKEVNLFSNQTF